MVVDHLPESLLYFPFGTQAGPSAVTTADQIIEIYRERGLRVVASRLGPATLSPEVNDRYREVGIPVFESPHAAVNAMCLVADHLDRLRGSDADRRS
ncbi:hypothetical protein [Blastococcus brunescens]|uniref:Uncharacterized protein n=1 Tax=Blastococcus brunescens TaxID=1564165 RepID=A0ABZ1B5J1_9ACTN|nr:hypothetical protein [Blastococcus sp. BMG 8361]WRL65406.1 hypothetical protein U6N30_07175 [Blastococcus sp. BMG 8361]